MDGLNNKNLDVLISTYSDRILDILKRLPSEKKNVRYLIGHQKYHVGVGEEVSEIINSRRDVLYFRLDSLGVTKSRNFLIKKSDADIIWFCDDDITFAENYYEKIISSHLEDNSDVITFIIVDETGQPRKKILSDNDIKKRSILNIMSVGTIEITIKKPHNHFFPEEMGAGTNLPVGDEAIFLANILKQGKKISFHPKIVCSHPCESSGTQNSVITAYSRGVTFRQVFGFFSFFMALPFIISRRKLFKINGGYFSGVSAFCKGLLIKFD
ncbi:glycosyltransferase [Superficieibacter sp. HKU1]|uniref:glycosyltransferase n=1 Tax=Superficieibacter sp. HKU1 TaxID=3031919 RepID=UPI0023E254BA|nr:glycosyltransferase [Superficieibacter sp. HKU1]WES66718.1 glycosyltransferase [Superficieibacter sp. HKU1]